MKAERTLDFDVEQARKEILDAGRNIWLAGLGVVARVEEEGKDLLETLVERGRKVEKQQFKTLDRTVSRTSDGLKEWSDRVQENVQKGMEEALHRFGLPSRHDLDRLSARINTLSKKVDHFVAERG
jgi:poly(hydroxyalkanoate) granule-associated protein